MAIRLEGSFATVVHQVPPRARLESTFATVVHQVPPRGRLEATFATVVHESGPEYVEPPAGGGGDGGGSGSDCGPPSTQVIPLRALASSQAYPSVTAALVIPVTARAGTQYVPDVERDSTQLIPHIYCDGLVADTLTVASSGTGQVLEDQYGTLPTDDNDVYLDPYTGEYLVIDDGYAEGDDLGELAAYGMPDATVAGVPASHRRRGYNQLANTTSTTQGHVRWNMAGSEHTFFTRNSHRASPASQVIAIGLESAERWGLQTINTARMDAKVWGSSGSLVRTVSLSSTGAFAAGQTYSAAVGADSAGTLRLDIWNGAGTSLGSLSGSFAALTGSLGGKDYAIGRGITGGDWTIGTIHEFLVFDGSVESNATTTNIEADVRSGVDLEVVKATYNATYASDGLITGVHSREAVEQLITLSGTGALPTASTQTAIGTYTQASEVNNLIGDWDAYREALYNGSAKLEGIQDFSGLDRHMTVRETVAPEHVASSCTMLGRSVTLPGRGTTTVANYAEYALTGTLDDFTLGFIIPTYQAGTAGNNQTLFSIEHTTGAENLIIRTDPVNDNQLDVIDHTGSVVASIDIGYASGNGAAANAIVFLRRTGGNMTLNSWHFEDAGGATVEETPVVFSDSTFRASFDMNGIAFGGLINGASTHWAGLLHRCVMYDRALTTGEVEAVAASFAGRLGIEGVGPPLSPPAVGDTVVTTGGDSVTTDSGDPVVTTA